MTRVLALIVVCLAAAACGGETGGPAPRLTARFPSWVPVVPLQLDDRDALPFLLDSGADVLRLSPELAQQLGAPQVGLLRFGDKQVHDLPYATYDTKTLSGLLGIELAGLAGNQIFDDLAVGIDYQRGAVYPLAAWRDDHVFGDHVVTPFQTHDVKLAGPTKMLLTTGRFEALDHDSRIIIDTGTSSTVISQSLFDALGADKDRRTVLRGSQAISAFGNIDSPIIRIRSLRLGSGPAARQVWATVLPDLLFGALGLQAGAPVDAIVGGAYLREFLAVLDYPAAKLHLAAYRSLEHLPKAEFQQVGVEVLERDGAFRIFTVFEGSDAAKQGIAVDDVLERIGSEVVSALTLPEVRRRLEGSPGSHIDLTLTNAQRGSYTVQVLCQDLLPRLP